MGSEFLDVSRTARYERFEYDFPEKTLASRIILAPGGAGGLGAATVDLLVREGAQVVVGYRCDRARAERLAATLSARGPGQVVCVEGDLRTPEARQRLLEAADQLDGELYALVSFLGDPARVNFARLDESALEASLATNYVAPILLARQVGERLLAQQVSGSLVFLATMQAVEPFEGSLNYAAPKAALLHAARILAREWGSLRVNVVAPGVTLAGMARASIESGKYDAYLREKIIPRFGHPEDVARVIRLLLEPDNYINGQVITVDGGLTLRRGLR